MSVDITYFWIELMTRNLLIVAITLAIGAFSIATPSIAADQPNAREVALEIDQIINEQLKEGDVKPALRSNDEDFLRRITLDISGTVPSVRDSTLFGLSPSRTKRADVIDRLLQTDAYADTWARYWRDVIFVKATNARAPQMNNTFLRWMTTALQENRGWDKIADEMLTSSGDIKENGATAIFFVQEGSTEDIAGEVSRIFLGIQMQCANCHDHPWDRWKREQFHELAAFFPRVGLRPVREDGRTVSYEIVSANATNDRGKARENLMQNLPRLFRFVDKNRDGKLTKAEVANSRSPLSRGFDRLVQVADKNKDGALSQAEIKEAPQPMQQNGRGSAEHFMADLNDPQSPGKLIAPKFFLTSTSAKTGLEDIERREAFSQYLTSKKNTWFATAIVNRMWGELTGEGFYMPIDDMGPDREPSYPQALELLAVGFVNSNYDLKWLMKTITLTQAYQRAIRTSDPNQPLSFASATPTRLRGDQIYNSIMTVLSGQTPNGRSPLSGTAYQGGQMRRGPRNPRDAFSALFGFDPSTPQSDITGNVPQALFMMNSPQINNQVRANFGTRLSKIVGKYKKDSDAIAELYLMVLSREPSKKELAICQQFITELNNRNEAYEDLMWSLLNSTEFITKR
jgi:hypothetical protein